MKNIWITLSLGIVVLTSCSPATAVVIPNTPPNSPYSEYLPKPGDSALVRNPIFLDSADLVAMKSFSLLFSLHLKGSLPTPCHQLRVTMSLPDLENKVHLDIYSVTDPNMVCAEVLEPFEINLTLGSFPSGHYILLVNETQVAEFDA